MPATYTTRPRKLSFMGNVDTLYFSVDAENYLEVINTFIDRFEDGSNHTYETGHTKILEIGEIAFEILPWGKKPCYKYQIRNKDLAFYFSPKLYQNNYPIYVQVNQFYLWENKLEKTITTILYILAEMGFLITDTKVSRVDLCCHTDQWEYNFTDAKYFKYHGSIKHPTYIHMNPEGIFETMQIGTRSRMFLRIYFKSLEIKAKNKLYFREIYEKNGLDPDKVWNIEYEIGRPILKVLGINTVDDLCNNIQSLWGFCTDAEAGWFSMFDKRSKNSSRWKELQFWSYVRSAPFGNYESIPLRECHLDWSIEKEIPQIRGRLKKIALRYGYVHYDDALDTFKELLDEKEKDKEEDYTFETEVKNLAKLYMNDIRKKEKKNIIDQGQINDKDVH